VRASGWVSLTSAAIAAVVVGYVSTILIVMKGSEAVGASVAQQSSNAAMTCFGMAFGSLYLGWRYRMPLIVAWSTPGSALLAASSFAGQGISYADAIGAFVFAGFLMVLTALVKPLARAISALPPAIAAAMLAGVLVKFVIAVPTAALASPGLVLPLVLVYFVLRFFNSMFAVPAVVIVGVALALLGRGALHVPLEITPLIFEMPTFNAQALVSIGVPVYLVTMASQNLPGLAVLRANGYQPPVAACLGVTGVGSMLCAPFGTLAINMAAITASLVASREAHEDPSERWKSVFPYFIVYVMFGLAAATFVGTLGALPKDIVAAIAGLALFGPLMNGITAMSKNANDLEPALITFIVTASGVVVFGIGAAFWGLLAGLIVWGAKRIVAQ
jgi:benzoate membrane transport protein